MKQFPRGRLDWRFLVQGLQDDGGLTAAAAQGLTTRFGNAETSLHPLVRLGNVGLIHSRTGATLDVEGLTQWLASYIALPYLKIDPLKVDVARVADVMSVAYAESRRALPVSVSLADVTVATCEPLDTQWTAEIEAHTKKKLRIVVASPSEIAKYTTEFYTLSRSVRAANKKGETSALASFEQLVELGKTDKQLDANDQGVVQLVDWLWQYAFEQRASDIHLEPRREMGVIRFRIDGVLHTVYPLPAGVMTAITARIKLLGRMDVVERRRPQDGRIKTYRPARDDAPASEVEMRLATLPTAFGEKVVMRIFDPEAAVKSVEGLGFSARDAQRWSELTAKPHGIILVTGPTGSGKTTTLYATLKRLATEDVNVCTLEDPIEMVEPAFNQTQVQPGLDLGFAEGVRALMRQDPDIIMVGEIRDLATAEMAVQAALTGHLVLSTLHTNDAASAITRLTDLGVPPYLISATVMGVLAQRLARTLCPACKQPDTALSPDVLSAHLAPWKLKGNPQPYKAVGCLECRNSGYRGRVGLYELMTVGDVGRQFIHPTVNADGLRKQAAVDGMIPLRVAGVMKVAEGLTTLDEVLRMTPAWERSDATTTA